jgi:1,2-diacylglycerol 3-alpha-glucosyltransferase
MPPLKIAVIFDNFGPYHLARLQASAAGSRLLAVEVAAKSAVYAWNSRTENGGQETANGGDSWQTITLLDERASRNCSHRDLAGRLSKTLLEFQPQSVFIPGWSSKAAFAALSWCACNGVPAVAMSESTVWDEQRVRWREAVKRRIVRLCSSALVGGRPHKDYMVKLGMPPERIFSGYDAVDNRYFAGEAEEIRRQKTENRKKHDLPENYFLASARFVEQKNLPRLLEAFALYRKKSQAGNAPSAGWDLILLGDGPLRPDLCRLIAELQLSSCVRLPGFKQYPELPVYYGLASAFIHASTMEPWGLVVNEAMASGLPVLVSNRCGCAADLVQEGVNGFTFDPCNVEQMAESMLRLANLATGDGALKRMGDASQEIIGAWGPERFAQGLLSAAETALKHPHPRLELLDRVLLQGLMYK